MYITTHINYFYTEEIFSLIFSRRPKMFFMCFERSRNKNDSKFVLIISLQENFVELQLTRREQPSEDTVSSTCRFWSKCSESFKIKLLKTSVMYFDNVYVLVLLFCLEILYFGGSWHKMNIFTEFQDLDMHNRAFKVFLYNPNT